MKAHLARLLNWMTWANRRSLAALADAPAAQDAGLPLLAHVLAAEQVWLARLEQRAAPTSVWPALTVAECAALIDENARGYAAFLQPLSEADLSTTVRYRNLQGQEFVTPIGDILTHVTTHGGYHRGQIAKEIGRTGVAAVNTDFITYVRETPPGR